MEISQKKPMSKWKKVLIVVGIIILFIIAWAGIVLYRGFQELPMAQEKILNFAQLLADQKIDEAYKLSSEVFQENVSRESMEQLADQKFILDGITEIHLTWFKIRKNANEPTYYDYWWTVSYNDGEIGELTAILVKENSEFKVQSFNIKTSFERVNKFKDK